MKSHKNKFVDKRNNMKNLYQELPLLQHASIRKTAMTETFSSKSRKTVRFSESDSRSRNIPSHRDYSPLEHRSVWYTPTEYGVFALNEVREKMTMPLVQRKEKHKRMLRIDNVRRTVLKSQSYQFLESKLPTTGNEYTEWLANYVHEHSEQSAAEARQRGIENDLELLDIKMQEMASRITTKRAPNTTSSATSSITRRKHQEELKTNLSKNSVNKNARWSNDDLRDVAPTIIERGYNLRIELCKDFCLDKSIGGTPIKAAERGVNSRRRRRGSIRLYQASKVSS